MKQREAQILFRSQYDFKLVPCCRSITLIPGVAESVSIDEEMEETWGFLIDDCRVRLANDGLARDTCQLCGRLDSVRSPEQKKRLGLLRSSLLKSKILPRELVPARDIFITDYTHSWYIKQSVYELFGDELSQHLSVKLEKWRIEG